MTLGMWLLYDGWYNKMNNIKGAALKGTIFVGPQKDPVAFIKRYVIKEYLTDEFIDAYMAWQRFHLGMGLPGNGGWANQPKRTVEIIEHLDICNRRIENSK